LSKKFSLITGIIRRRSSHKGSWGESCWCWWVDIEVEIPGKNLVV